jgi:hypothetical protein
VNICQQAAAESSLFRHWDQALAIVADAKVSKVVGVTRRRPLSAIGSAPDDLTAPSAAHPATRALEGRRHG